MRELTDAGDGGNVTVPHKTVAAEVVESATEELVLTGACNTFWLEDGRICGDNTDVAGFKAALTALAGDVRDARVLMLGAGGAARAVVVGLHQLGAGPVAVWNRSPARLQELRDQAGRIGRSLDAWDRREPFDIVINATSVGLHANDAPPVAAVETGARYALDLVYRVGGTPWSVAATAAGLVAADGLEMLLQQGARAFERWFRRSAPIDVMRAAIAEATSRTA